PLRRRPRLGGPHGPAGGPGAGLSRAGAARRRLAARALGSAGPAAAGPKPAPPFLNGAPPPEPGAVRRPPLGPTLQRTFSPSRRVSLSSRTSRPPSSLRYSARSLAKTSTIRPRTVLSSFASSR